MHPGFFNYENSNPNQVFRVTKAPPTLLFPGPKIIWPSFLQKSVFSDHQQPEEFGGREG